MIFWRFPAPFKKKLFIFPAPFISNPILSCLRTYLFPLILPYTTFYHVCDPIFSRWSYHTQHFIKFVILSFPPDPTIHNILSCLWSYPFPLILPYTTFYHVCDPTLSPWSYHTQHIIMFVILYFPPDLTIHNIYFISLYFLTPSDSIVEFERSSCIEHVGWQPRV